MAHYILIYNHPELGERRFELEPNATYRIGSKTDSDIVIPQKDVSRHHAILKTFERSFQITDLDSKNGTFVNGQAVATAEFRCGDDLNISSARLDIIEVSSDAFRRLPEVRPTPPLEAETDDSDDTLQFRSEASVEDMVELLETAASSVATSSVAEILGWSVDHLGLETAAILYRDEAGRVAILGSAGDLGPLVQDQDNLGALVAAGESSGTTDRNNRRVEEVAEGMLLASLPAGYVLVLRYSGLLPAVADIRALMAAVVVVLSGGRARAGLGGGSPAAARGEAGGGAGADRCLHLDPRSLLEQPLGEAREDFERWMVTRVLAECGGNQSRAARRLGMSRAGLFKKLKKLELR